MINHSAMLSHPLIKVLPHLIDAVLLISAIGLIMIVQQYPFYHHWLTVKVVALLVYIFLGMIAFKWAKTKFTKVLFWALAMMVFGYIVSVALTKTPLWFVA